MSRARVFLADDHSLILEALTNLLQPEFEVIGTAMDGLTLLELAPKLKPNVIVVDLGMPLLNGMTAGEQLKKALPLTKLIVLTINEDFELAAEALRRFASGYLLKKCATSDLVKAIRETLKGRTYVTPEVSQWQNEEFVRDPRAERAKKLTPRQQEVLQLLAEGRTMKEAAWVLRVKPRTIAFHKYRIMEEFGLKTNSDLLHLALKKHIVMLR